MNNLYDWPEFVIDARSFQNQLRSLSETVALKVQREGPQQMSQAKFVCDDFYAMLRQSISIYDLFFFMNAEERRKKDPGWRIQYSAAILPLVRSMIDCLYNITAILQNPGVKGFEFRASGYMMLLRALAVEEARYKGQPNWDKHLEDRRARLNFLMRGSEITETEARGAEMWPTLGKYVSVQQNNISTPHQDFLRTFTLGFWREYSAMAHAMFEGLMPTAIFFTPGDVPHQDREIFDSKGADRLISLHLARVATVLLCTVTELQVYFKFEGARIAERLYEVWDALMPDFTTKELYDERYAKLMDDNRIWRRRTL
jgi:hypothetical protein